MTRDEKWDKVKLDIIKSMNSIKYDDKDMNIMVFDVVYNLSRMITSEESFNDILHILNTYKTTKIQRSRKK